MNCKEHIAMGKGKSFRLSAIFYTVETKTKFYFKGCVCVSNLPIIRLSRVHCCNRKAALLSSSDSVK